MQRVEYIIELLMLRIFEVKVQQDRDQLVLLEEIFGNSNFTNNVTSGNMADTIFRK